MKIIKNYTLIIFACALAFLHPLSTLAYTENTLDWRKTYLGVAPNDITFGNGLYVAIGEDGTIQTSNDGIEWEYQKSPVNNEYFYDVTFGNGCFVAVGITSIISSYDGVIWSVRQNLNEAKDCVVFANNLFVAAGSYGEIMTSADGVKWETKRASDFDKTAITEIASDGSRFVAISSIEGNEIYYSENGDDWEVLKPDESYAYFENLEYANGKFIFYAYPKGNKRFDNYALFVSQDGKNYIRKETANNFNSITTDISGFVAFSGGTPYSGFTISRSSDGENWDDTTIQNSLDINSTSKFLWVNNQYFLMGLNRKLKISSNATQWQDAVYKTSNNIPENYLSSGETSTNGTIYVKVANDPLGTSGEGAVGMRRNGNIYTSVNNNDWSKVIGKVGCEFASVAYGNGIFVVVGDNISLSSHNGTDWAESDHLDDMLHAVIWDSEQFIASGVTMYYSADGLNWIKEENPATARGVYKLFYGAGEYLGQSDRTIVRAKKPDSFIDMKGHWGDEYTQRLSARSVVNGTGQGFFSPEESVTRAEFAAMLIRAFPLKNKGVIPEFNDVSKNAWYYNNIVIASQNSVMDGDANGNMRPDNPISREEAMAMVIRCFSVLKIDSLEEPANNELNDFEDTPQISEWARSSVEICVKNNLVKGYDNKLYPALSIRRVEAATIVSRLLTFIYNDGAV